MDLSVKADLLADDSVQQHALKRAHHIIEGLDAAAAHEFARVTDVVLGDESAPAAWTGGLLNQTGAPLEFSFSTASDDLRYTMEVGGSDTPPACRLGRVEGLLATLGVDSGWDGVAREFPSLQHGHSLAWGAWLGARQTLWNAHAATTLYKIYAEIPFDSNAEASSLPRRYLGAQPLPAGPCAQLVVAGAAPGSQRCEFYFEIHSRTFTRSYLSALLDRVGLARRLDDLVALVGSFEFRHGRVPDALPNAQYGFSYSVLPGGGEPVFSVFIFAADLAGGDAWVRQQILAARHRESELRGYAAMTESLTERHARASSHNMVTFSVDETARAGLQVSLSPPPSSIDSN